MTMTPEELAKAEYLSLNRPGTFSSSVNLEIFFKDFDSIFQKLVSAYKESQSSLYNASRRVLELQNGNLNQSQQIKLLKEKLGIAKRCLERIAFEENHASKGMVPSACKFSISWARLTLSDIPYEKEKA